MSKIGNPYVTPNDLSPQGLGGLLKAAIAAGGAPGTLLAVAGMQAEDAIISLIEAQYTAGSVSGLADRTADVTAVEAGGFRLGGASTAGNQLIVFWLDKR